MIQFLGLHLGIEAASALSLGKDLQVSARVSTKMVNAARDPATGAVEVPVAEWARAGSYALQETYLTLPVSERKAWGMGLSGPAGWIALDVELEPLSPLRILDEAGLIADLRGWMDANPRLARKISVLLSPKDYFRFVLSGGLAADVTSASRLGLLQPGKSLWSGAGVAASGMDLRWLPPVFDGHVKTGTLTEEGIRRTSLPGGFWLVAGTHEDEAALLPGPDPRRGSLRVIPRPAGPALLARDLPDLREIAPPPGWRVVRSPIAGTQTLEKDLALPEGGPGSPEAMKLLEEERSGLRAAGLEAGDIETGEWSPELGAAVLAAVGSGLVKGWDAYFKHRDGDSRRGRHRGGE